MSQCAESKMDDDVTFPVVPLAHVTDMNESELHAKLMLTFEILEDL